MKTNFSTSRAWLKLGLLMLLAAASSIAVAQDLVQPYRDFKPVADLATRLMEGLLGSTYTSPFTAGIQSNSLFGAIFLVFNIIVFAVGTVFASYGVVAGIVQTAHEGVVMGKRMSAVWMPVRMVTGIGGLIPAFGGFSLSQVAMIVATSWGISFANYAYDQALTAAASTATLVSPGFSRTDPNKDANAIAQALFKQRLCENAFALKKASFESNNPPVYISKADEVKQFAFSKVDPGGTTIGRAVGTDSDNTKCFAIGLKRKTYLGGLIDQEGRWGSSATGFRSGAVDYASINEESWRGYASNFPEFVSRVHSIADNYQDQVLKSSDQIRVPNDEIRAAGVWFGGAAKVKNLDHKTIKEDALSNMRKYGWFGAGSFYSTHAEVNAAVMQAADATEFVIINPSNRTQNLTGGDFDSVSRLAEESTGNAGTGASQPGTSFCLVGQNATGNCSFGQKIVEVMLNAGTAGAGGAASVVDPIIALKNIGDYFMVLGEGILAASYFGNTIGKVVGMASGPAVAVTTVVAPGAAIAASLASDLVQALAGLAPVVGGMLFAVGALCAIYIPMVPFINWVSGLVQYCCIVVEAMAAAPLWALAHLQADGEGMGQRTERGYLYLLNLLFRPILMVVAFFAASALVILLGSLVVQMFIPAMAAAQGNSITGIFSAIGYVFLFFVIMNTIIQGLFHLITELADDALGWVGGVGKSNIGRDVEGKVNQMFVMGGRFGQGSAANAVKGAGKK